MTAVFEKILNMSITASLVILVVMVVRILLRKAPKVYSYALWAVVLFRLVSPISLPSPVALLDMARPQVTEQTQYVSYVSYIPTAPAQTDPQLPPASQYAQTQPAPEQAISAMALGAAFWTCGMAIMGLYSLVSWLRLRREVLASVRVKDNVYLADNIGSPFVMGVLRPKIYLPSAISGRERRFILAHEQHHIRRGDHVVKLLAWVALCVHWFNPLAWVAFVLAGKDMEMSCDEAVIARLGTSVRADYAQSLLRLATHQRIIAFTPLAFGEGDTKGRVLNMAKWKKPKFWISIVCVIVCVAVLAACALNPEQADEVTLGEDSSLRFGELVMRLPQGYSCKSSTEGGVLFLLDGKQVGGVERYDLPEGDMKYPDDLALAIGLEDARDDTLGYIGGGALYGDMEIIYFDELAPEKLNRRHTFFLDTEQVYDVWFDENSLTQSAQTEILMTVSIGVETAMVSVQFGDVTLALPGAFLTGLSEQGGISFMEGERIVGGLECYSLPMYTSFSSDAYGLARAMGLPQALDDSLAASGADSSYADMELRLWDPKDTALYNAVHYFYLTGNSVYDLWFDQNLVTDSVEYQILPTVAVSVAESGEIPEETGPQSDDALAQAALEQCRAVVEMVQSSSHWISNDRSNEGESILNDTSSMEYYRDGEDYLLFIEIPEQGILDGVPVWSSKFAYMYKNGVCYDNEKNSAQDEHFQVYWNTSSQRDIWRPWLSTYTWDEDDVQYVTTLQEGSGEAILLKIYSGYGYRDDAYPGYHVTFHFNGNGAFRYVEVQAALILDRGEEYHFTDRERIRTLDAQTVAAEIDREYQRAVDE